MRQTGTLSCIKAVCLLALKDLARRHTPSFMIFYSMRLHTEMKRGRLHDLFVAAQKKATYLSKGSTAEERKEIMCR